MKISDFVEYLPTDWTGLTTANHIGQIYGLEPQFATKLVSRLLEVNFGDDLESFLDQFGALYLDSNESFRWMLQGNSRKNIPLVRAEIDGVAVVGTDQAGKFNSRFTLVFNEAHFSDQNLIVGNKNEAYPVRIVQEPIPVGPSEYHYLCELMHPDPTVYIPFEELQGGTRWSREWTPVERTLSTKGGLVTYTSPFSMINDFSFIRMEDTRPGDMIDKPVAFNWEVPVGGDYTKGSNPGKTQTMSTWMQYADWEFETQFREEKNKLLYFARSNKSADGTFRTKGISGYEIIQGAGIRQQMESSNTAYYGEFDIKWATERMLDLSVGKLSKDKRKFIWRTGEWGMYQFSESLEDYVALYTPLQDDTRIVAGKDNSMTYKGQFLNFMGPNGVEITVSHEPMYDNPERNKLYHPKGGLAESYRYDILDVGTSDGEPNVRKVYKKGSEDYRGYIQGLRSPFEMGKKNVLMSHGTDGYTIHRGTECGAMVKDPTRTVAIIPLVLQGVGAY